MFNAASAITFNNTAGFPGYIIRGIRSAVGAPEGETWDLATVTYVSTWQFQNGLDDDGKVGSMTIGKLLDAMLAGFHFIDAAALKAWWEYKKAGKAIEVASVVSHFEPSLVYPFKFRKFRAWHPGKKRNCDWWSATGTFQVDVRLNPQLSEADRARYEFRQYISGTASLQPGFWKNGAWRPNTPLVIKNIGPDFGIPADPDSKEPQGLTVKEKPDGMITQSGTTFQFGVRTEYKDEEHFRNKWLPDENGPDFTMRDTPGYVDVYTPGDAPRVNMSFKFRGAVVEVEEVMDGVETTRTKVVREVVSKSWAYNFSGELNWATTTTH